MRAVPETTLNLINERIDETGECIPGLYLGLNSIGFSVRLLGYCFHLSRINGDIRSHSSNISRLNWSFAKRCETSLLFGIHYQNSFVIREPF